ncbi:MAG: hypothetical protein AAB089_04485 [Nitrospirota bacterium]
MKRARCGQSTLEYVIILAAVVGAIILAAGVIKTKLTGTDAQGYKQLTNSMRTKINDLAIK